MHVILNSLTKKDTVYLPTVKILEYISEQLRIYQLCKNIRHIFLGVNMFDLYVTICKETPEVMILDRNVFRMRSKLQRNCE